MSPAARIAFLAILACGLIAAQSYEVASVKLSGPNSQGSGFHGGPGTKEPGAIRYTHISLKVLVMFAYEVHPSLLSGPSFMDDTFLDITAKVPAGASYENRNAMLRELLEERLHLQTHREFKKTLAYSLTVAKGGIKMPSYPAELPPTASHDLKFTRVDQDGFPYAAPDHAIGMSMSKNNRTLILGALLPMKSLCSSLTGVLKMPVVDRTGLEGRYDYRLIFAANRPQGTAADGGPVTDAPDPSLAPDIGRALEKQLGLKLERKKQPVEFLIIDHVDRTPTEG